MPATTLILRQKVHGAKMMRRRIAVGMLCGVLAGAASAASAMGLAAVMLTGAALSAHADALWTLYAVAFTSLPIWAAAGAAAAHSLIRPDSGAR
jgi:hypothetical protein